VLCAQVYHWPTKKVNQVIAAKRPFAIKKN
jgi:hypothetical protein